MLIWILAWTLVALCGVSIGVAILSKNVFLKLFSLLLVAIFVGTSTSVIPLKNKAFKNATISNIEIEEVYKDENNYYYVRKTGDTDMIRLKPNKIYKGDSNYVIKYDYPSMTGSHSFWLEEDKIQYDLVVTDLKIDYLPSLN